MEQKSEEYSKKIAEMDAVSKALSSIYTGVFAIDVVHDTYSIVKSTRGIAKMLTGIESAQLALNIAVKRTVDKDEMVDMLTFTNLKTLSARMRQKKSLSIEYKGVISGWVRGSFMEIERDPEGNLIRILYVYQVIDEDKRKELEHLQELKQNYVLSEKENRESREKNTALEEDKQVLEDDLEYQNNFVRVVMEQINCGIVVYTIPGRNILEINREALRIFGWKDAKEAADKFQHNWKKVSLIGKRTEADLVKLREKDSSLKYQFVLNAGKKDAIYVLAESKSLSGRYGGKVIMSTFTDITDIRSLEADKVFLKDANIELQRARDAVQTILKSGSYLCTYAEDGEELVSIKFSDALRKLYGYSGTDDAPDTWEMWLKGAHPKDREHVEQSYYAALRDRTGETKYDVTFRAIKKDGTIRWYRAAADIVRRADGTAEFSYGLVMDVNEQKEAANQAKEALQQAKIANAAKSSFLARMSHDIRTPMNGIMGLIEINERHADDLELTSRNRKKAKVAADHLLSLINDVLQLSKLEDPKVDLSYEAFNIQQLSEAIMIIIEQRAIERQITVTRNDDPSIQKYPYVYGSPLHVKQIFINLLGNSIKYNKDNGSIICRASMETIDEKRVNYKVVIRDTGIGMSEEFLQHLFEPFTREKEETEGGREGTGLGMSIVKQLLDKMGGSIKVDSTPGVGSCFTVEIPFEIADREALDTAENENLPENLQGRRILLVEDNELNRDIAEIILKDAGIEVVTAVNGQEAVNCFEEHEPGTFDVILMDVMMPVMNGYEATKKIRSLKRKDAKEIPIIAITANAYDEDVECAMSAGMNDHLSKPLNIQKMIAIITRYVKLQEKENGCEN